MKSSINSLIFYSAILPTALGAVIPTPPPKKLIPGISIGGGILERSENDIILPTPSNPNPKTTEALYFPSIVIPNKGRDLPDIADIKISGDQIVKSENEILPGDKDKGGEGILPDIIVKRGEEAKADLPTVSVDIADLAGIAIGGKDGGEGILPGIIAKKGEEARADLPTVAVDIADIASIAVENHERAETPEGDVPFGELISALIDADKEISNAGAGATAE